MLGTRMHRAEYWCLRTRRPCGMGITIPTMTKTEAIGIASLITNVVFPYCVDWQLLSTRGCIKPGGGAMAMRPLASVMRKKDWTELFTRIRAPHV